MKTNQEKFISRFIRSLSKDKSKEELRQAELNYLRFLKLAERVSTRLTNEAHKINANDEDKTQISS